MNKDLAEIIIYYATKPQKELNELLVNKSKNNLISILTDLLTVYINDKNSSSLREFVTVSVSGYNHNPEKLGYNGFKHNSTIGGQPIACEAKPKNIQTENYDQKKTKSKLNGEGGFNDYTIERLRKDIKENPNILSSGFIDGQLLYILEFPFSLISKHLKKQVPKNRTKGTYKRMASFNFNHYFGSKKIKVIYLNRTTVENNKKYFNLKFLKHLLIIKK